MGFNCDNNDGNEAVVLLTVIETGDPLPYCATCIPQMVKVMADMMGVAEVAGGTLTDGQIFELAAGREMVIATIKESNPAKAARMAEMETVIRAVHALVHGEVPTEGTYPPVPDPDDEDEGHGDQPDSQSDEAQQLVNAGVAAANAGLADPPGF